jgi:hypothetical protein
MYHFGFLSPIINFFEKFNFNSKTHFSLYRKVFIVFLLVVLIISAFFINKAFKAAKEKSFWADEQTGLNINIKNQNVIDLVIMGARGQGSLAPLNYILVKWFYNIREFVSSFGLHYNVYYRLNSIFCTLIFGVAAILLTLKFLHNSSSNLLIFIFQNIFLLLSFIFYLFWPFSFHYSIEMRPYALWNSLWFMTLVSFFYYQYMRWVVRVLLVLLAATATASVFQVGCFMGAYLFCVLLRKEVFKKVVAEVLKTFTIPLIVAFYYILRSQGANDYSSQHDLYVDQFFKFWFSKELIPILTVAGILITVKFKEGRNNTIIFVTMLFLYLLSPVLNYFVLEAKFFFSSRQYLYYDLIYPLFFINFAILLPQYYNFLKKLVIANKQIL